MIVRAQPLLGSLVMRRLIAILTIIMVLALAMTLLWRVYVHHTHTNPNESNEPVVVEQQKLRSA